MNYEKKNLKQGITFHSIKTNKFKTNLFSVILTTKLEREAVTLNALLTSVLRRGSKSFPTQDLISKELEKMYGASFDCGVEKSGDNHLLKFYIECINDEFLPVKENLSQKCFEILLDIVFNPLVENNGFKEEYLIGEKETLTQIINGKIDNKAKYAGDRCIEEMYKDEPYGLYKYGYVEDLEKITATELYDYYKKITKTAKIDIFASGDLNDDTINGLQNTNAIKSLQETSAEYNVNRAGKSTEKIENPKIINESMNVAQGKLVIGLDVLPTSYENKYQTSVYNVILGGSSNSKMFQNVREKASLAYTAGSVYLRQKDNIFIKAGIDIPNYDKALKIIKDQLEQMKNGEFSEQDIADAKLIICSSIQGIPENQDAEITYYLAQELSDTFTTLEDYEKNINNVSKDEIVNIANNIQINTIYFLKD